MTTEFELIPASDAIQQSNEQYMALRARAFEVLRSTFNSCVTTAVQSCGEQHFIWRVEENGLPICQAVADEICDFMTVLKNLKYACGTLERKRFSPTGPDQILGYVCAWGTGCDAWVSSATGETP